MGLVGIRNSAARRGLTVTSPDAAAEFWRRWGVTRGFAGRDNRNDTAVHDDNRTVAAYVNQGRWVADCPNCGGGMFTEPGWPRGCCLDCGTSYQVKHPAERTVAAAEKALLARPVSHRNWNPQTETPARLAAENRKRGDG